MEETQESSEIQKKNFATFYNKNYKKFLIIPTILLIASIVFILFFYSQTGDFIKKDVSLTGGTSITVFGEININELSQYLSENLDDFSIRELSDFRTGKQEAVIIESPVDSNELKQIIEDYLGFSLTNENSSIEFSGSTLSRDFFKQLIFAIIIAFSLMAFVVFMLFGAGRRIRIISGTLTILPLLVFWFNILNINYIIFFTLVIFAINLFIYAKNSIPSIAIVLSAFADIIMTLAVVDLLNIKLSTAGIVAFLMLIGYSVDTDIMLTTRLLKRKHEGESNKRLSNAFKTGITMTITSLIAVIIALIITKSFSEILGQIFTILVIGLSFDLINTWFTNASILKWHLEKSR